MSMGRILVADDEPQMRKLIEMSLRRAGLEMIAAVDGEEAVSKAVQEQPDAIILDVTMPGMDGFDALKELKSKEDTAAIPVIVLTSKGRAIARQEAESLGAAAFLNKPFSPRILAEEIARLIRRPD